MFRLSKVTLREAAAVAALVTAAALPVSAQQVSVNISFDDFHARLAPYGAWSHNDRWGDVWRPARVASDFRPYYNGHWEDTREYGWLWVSDEPWGDIAYHYGRWVFDPRDGWLWVPGFVWGPSWVVWRSGGGDIGWFPMPPDDDYYGNGPYRYSYDDEYGYRNWYGASFTNDQFLSLWVFVGENHFHDRNFRSYALPVRDYGTVIKRTTDTTNYVTINNYVVNRSVDTARLQRDTKQTFQPVAASAVVSRTAIVTPATVGRQIEQRERKAHPIPVNINPAEVRGTNRNTGPGAGPATPQAQPAAPPAGANRPGGNPAPQGPQGRGNDRNQGTGGAGKAAPQAGRAAPVRPEANTNRQNDNQPQGPQGGANNGGNGNRGGQANPQAERANPLVPPQPATDNAGRNAGEGNNRNGGGRGNNQAGPAAIAPPPNLAAPPPRPGAVAPGGRAVVQGNPAPPAANGRGNAGDNHGRGNNAAGAPNAGDQKAADEKKKADDKKKNDGGPN